ncbi:MAG: hypothetical protein N3G75_06090 [Methanothrix sp.]|nr:hypothetical protein [Methanothrix sp.]MCX8207384.1 hypothetical protein [Methanothrix sp.]
MIMNKSGVGVCLLLAALLLPMADAISVSYGSSGYSGSVSVSEAYQLDDSTALAESTDLSSGAVSQSTSISGTGLNLVSKSVSGGTYGIAAAAQSYGALGMSTSLSASSASGGMSQSVSGTGNIAAVSEGTSGADAVCNIAHVENGLISTTQSISSGGSVSGSQSTSLEGEIGVVGSISTTGDSAMAVTGDIIGEGKIDADLRSSEASITGQVSVDGTTWMDSQDMSIVGSNDFGIAVEGLRVAGGGIGAFSVNAAHVSTAEATKSNVKTNAMTYYQNSPLSYTTTGWRWNKASPLVLYLKADSNLASEGLNSNAVKDAITNAAETWDEVTSRNLFYDEGVIIDSNKNADNPYDGYSVHAWKYLSLAPSALAYSRTRYGSPKVNGYYTVFESDVSYNTRYSWTTDLTTAVNNNGRIFDVQTVALHELGHTLGLGDLYTLPSTDPRKGDYSQIMNSYNDPQRTLGNGDKAGILKLYGN